MSYQDFMLVNACWGGDERAFKPHRDADQAMSAFLIHVAGVLPDIGGAALLIGIALTGAVDLLDLLALPIVSGNDVGVRKLFLPS